MRFILIVVGIIAIIYFVGKKALNSVFMGDTKEIIEKSGVMPYKQPKQNSPAPVQGGSIATSIRDSMQPSSTPQKPVISRQISFKFRPMPTAEQLQGLASAGLLYSIDPVMRSLYIRGPFDLVADIGNYFDSTDTVSPDCALRGWVVFVSDSDSKAFDFSAAFGMPSLRGGDFKGTMEAGQMVLNMSFGELRTALSFLQESEGVQLLQEPMLRLVHRTESRIESTEEVPIPSTTVSNGIATASIEYRKVGLELAVTPEFLGSDRLRLNCLQIGGIVGRTVTVSGNEIPVLQTQKLQSHVELTVGQTVLLGGVKTSRSVQRRGLLSVGDEQQTGYTFVVLSTYSDAPQAYDPALPTPVHPLIPAPVVPDPFSIFPPGFLDFLKPDDIDTAKGGRIGPRHRK